MAPPERAASPVVPFSVAIATPHAERVRPDMALLGLLAIGHMMIDTNQGSLPAILPFLRSALDLSYAATGTIVLVANVASSLIQPLFGYLADQSARRWLLPSSVLLSALGIGFMGLAPSYWMLLGLVVIAGLGAAAYHPEGYRTATAVAGDRRVTGVSIFSTGGNVGVAIGPPLMTALVTGLGLPGSIWMLAPGLLVAGLLTLALPRLSGPRTLHAASTGTQDSRTMAKAMSLLILVIALRSWTQIGFTTFVPFYYLDVLHGDPRMVGTLLAVFLGAGVVGTLVAGPIADRIGVRLYFVSALLLATPLAVVFLFARGMLAVLVLGALGFVLVSSFTASVVLGQAYMPKKPGLASGLAVGFAFGAGGIGASTLGWVADHWGLFAALSISAVMPAAAFCVSLLLPEPRPAPGDRYP